MTAALMLLTILALIGIIVLAASAREIFRRLACAYAMSSIYRNLPNSFLETMELADEIILRARISPLLRQAFRIGQINRGRILIMLDTLAALGLAEKSARQNTAFEKKKDHILDSTDRMAASIPAGSTAKERLRDIENQLKTMRMSDTVWRKKFRGNIREPGITDFLATQD